MVTFDSTDGLRHRILAEYREMPGLQLTLAQAARLWALDPGRCEEILRTLVDARRLRRTADGRFCVPGDLECAPRLSRQRARGSREDGDERRAVGVQASEVGEPARAGCHGGLAAALNLPLGTGESDFGAALDALRLAGLTPAAAPAVEWLPALEVAWIGGVEPAERHCLLVLAGESAISPEARALIATWCDIRPTELAFAAGRGVLGHRSAALPPPAAEALLDRVLDACDAVAGADGGWIGFGTVSAEERRLRHAICSQLAPARL